MQRLSSDFAQFVRNNGALVVWIAVAAILSYGLAVANVTVSIDEELHFISDSRAAWVQQGRFGIAAIKTLLGTALPLPYLRPALAILLLAASALLWCFVFARVTRGGLERSPWLKTFAVFFVSVPTNAYYLSFNTYNTEVSIGFAVSAACVLFSWRWIAESGRWASFLIGAVAAMLATSIYQSFLILCATGVVAAYLLNLQCCRDARQVAASELVLRSLRLAAPIGVGYLLYRLIDASVAPSEKYGDVFFNWGKLDNAFIFQWLRKYVVSFFVGTGFPGGWVVPPIAVAGAVAGAAMLVRARRAGDVLQVGMLLIVLVSPLLLSFAMGTPMPNRAQQVLPVAYGALILIFVVVLGLEAKARAVAAILTALLIAWNAQVNTRLFLSEYLMFERDKAGAHRIAERLTAQGWSGAPAPLVVFGSLAQPQELYLIKSETIGASYWEWGDGQRATYFLGFLGYKLRPPSPDEVKAVLPAAEAMPDWPKAGSVALIGGSAVVKFGAPTAAQLRNVR